MVIRIKGGKRMAEEKKSFFARLREGLTKTRNNIVKGFDSVFPDIPLLMTNFMKSWKRR